MKKTLLCLGLLLLVAFFFSVFVYAQPAPTGACCDSNNIKCASPITEESCLTGSPGNTWHANVSCEDNPCRPAIPTMNEWGMIIFMVLAGLGALYCFRRQRKA